MSSGVRASRPSVPPTAACPGGTPNERRPLWRRLSSTPPARAGFPHRGAGGRHAFTAPHTIREEAAWTDSAPRAPRAARTRRLRAGVSRLRRLWRDAAAVALASCIGVACFVTDALGLTARARTAYTDLMKRAAAMRGQFAARFARGSQLTRKLSAVALCAMGRGMSKTERVAGLLRRAMSAEGRLDTCGAIRCYQAANELVPDDPEPLVGLAKCISDRVFEPAIFANGDLARSMATQAAHLSERAIELTPDNPRAHLASAISLGRLALWSSNQRKIEISRTVRERVTAALKLSPDDDVALHVLGRWEYEMDCVGFAVRMVVKMVYGGLEVGSLTEAHRCLARAIELRPERLVHRVVMARILLKMNQQEEAVRQLEVALSLPVEDVNASHERAEATRMMLKLGRPVPAAPPPSAKRPRSESPPQQAPAEVPPRSHSHSPPPVGAHAAAPSAAAAGPPQRLSEDRARVLRANVEEMLRAAPAVALAAC